MLRPSPPGNSGAETGVRWTAGTSGLSGHHLRVNSAAPAPIAEPKRTSDGQCAPVCTREYATPVAIGARANPTPGWTRPAPRVKATAEAEWPDGKEELVGCGW